MSSLEGSSSGEDATYSQGTSSGVISKSTHHGRDRSCQATGQHSVQEVRFATRISSWTCCTTAHRQCCVTHLASRGCCLAPEYSMCMPTGSAAATGEAAGPEASEADSPEHVRFEAARAMVLSALPPGSEQRADMALTNVAEEQPAVKEDARW